MSMAYETGRLVLSHDEPGCLPNHVAISAPMHGMLAQVVWKMEDDDCTPKAQGNARRLVAAWNACGGVPTEVLEANAAGGLAWSFSDQLDLRMDRARLLEALTNLENDDGRIPNHAWALVQAAIAKSKAVL